MLPRFGLKLEECVLWCDTVLGSGCNISFAPVKIFLKNVFLLSESESDATVSHFYSDDL